MTTSNYLEEAWLKTLRGGGNGTTFTAPAAVYCKLHTGDPGEDGTSNAAGNTTRQAITFAAPANPGGTMDSNADVTWTSVSTAETYSYVSYWDASSAGNCVGSGLISVSTTDLTPNPKAVTVGDTYVLPSGSVRFTLT